MTTVPESSRAKGKTRATGKDDTERDLYPSIDPHGHRNPKVSFDLQLPGSLPDDPPPFDQTILPDDDTVSWEFPGMSKTFKYDEEYTTQTTAILDQGRPFPTAWDAGAILDFLEQNKKAIRIKDKDGLVAVRTQTDILNWAKTHPDDASHLFSYMLPLTYGYIYHRAASAAFREDMEYVQLLNNNFALLCREWSNNKDEVTVLQAQMDKRDRQSKLREASWQEKARKWKEALEERDRDRHRLLALINSPSQAAQSEPHDTVNNPADQQHNRSTTPFSQVTTASATRNSSSFLNNLRDRCENIDFITNIKSLPPPDKYDGNPEQFQLWAYSLLHYFQHHKKEFGGVGQKTLASFAQTRLEGKPFALIRTRSLSGYEFPNLFTLLELLYKTYGIKDLFSHYQTKFSNLRWPSGIDQVQNLADLKATTAVVKEALAWTDRHAINQILQKLPEWAKTPATHLRYDEDDYDSFLEALEEYFRRNQIARALTAASRTRERTTPANNNNNPQHENRTSSSYRPPANGNANNNARTTTSENQQRGPTTDPNKRDWRNGKFSPLPRQVQDKRDQQFREGKCFACGEAGHMAKTCPVGKTNTNNHITEDDDSQDLKMIDNASSESESEKE
ncbi:MAG: hypothetical protein M1839_003763 [Geoglossum umbratile]|nr:MAG: hypothetical protein M1839_003763 [Geoglossum umbratile]